MSVVDNPMGSPAPDRLASLFAQYREACPDPEPGPDFLPRLWQEIEARRGFGRKLALFARTLVATAAATCAVMMLLLLEPPRQPGFYDASYVDVLASSHMPDLPGELGVDNSQ